MSNLINDLISGIVTFMLGVTISLLVYFIIISIYRSIVREYYISFAISDGRNIAVGRTVLKIYNGNKINIADIIKLEEEWAAENDVDGIMVQNVYPLHTYIDLNTLFRKNKKNDKENKESKQQKENKNVAGPRLMR